MKKKAKILVAPLELGLGHTTRCIPIINELIRQGAEVFLAGNDVQTSIFENEFPGCKRLHLDGYNIKYAKKKSAFFAKMLAQLPGIFAATSREHHWLRETVTRYGIDAVISDNRYGLYHDSIPTVFITHQLHIKTTANFAEALLQKHNYNYINRFTRCWLPDYAGNPNLSGDLAHPQKMPAIKCSYIGPLSRMRPLQAQKINSHLLCMLSGPEPQRTILESLLLAQLKDYKGTATVVRGLPVNAAPVAATGSHISVFNHLDTATLNNEMCKAGYIICRSGYSSVMDIHATGTRSILVPTPGQTEQEYLAVYLQQEKFAICCDQKNFDLLRILQQAAGFGYKVWNTNEHNMLEMAVADLLAHICG